MRTRKTLCATLLGATLAIAGLAVQPGSESPDEAAIRQILAKHVEWTNAGNWQAIETEFVDDALVMPDFQPSLAGKAGITAWFRENLEGQARAGVTSRMTATLDEVRVHGDWAFDRGTFLITFTAKDGRKKDYRLRFLEIFARQADGSWKIIRGMNNNQPPLEAHASEGPREPVAKASPRK